jgi:tRNA-dihydrouridine synthase
MKSFWDRLPKPFTILAPMDGVTDVVFRNIINEVGRPDVFFTEFTNVEGLSSIGKDKVAEKLLFDKSQKPVIAQIWGINLDAYVNASRICKEMGFDGIDINMGCPDRAVIKNGSCSALIKNPELAKQIIEKVRDGAGDIPVSVKTRIGYSEIEVDKWIGFLLEQNLPALTIHLRTVAEMSLVPAHWELMPEVIKLRDQISPETLIIGNGDLKDMEEINKKYKEYRCDGFMVGRGIFSNPWFFNDDIDIRNVDVKERVNLYLKHIDLFEKTFPNKNPAFLKKFCKTYFNNFDDASSLREQVMNCYTTFEMKKILNNYMS